MGKESVPHSSFGRVHGQEVALSERVTLHFRAEVFNLNRANLASAFSGTVISPPAGIITTLAIRTR
jgi:hypothetical protein